MRSRVVELFARAVAPQRSNARQSVMACRIHVDSTIANHDRSSRVERMLGEEVREELALQLARAVELAAMHRDEVRVQAEMIHDALRVDKRLRSRHVKLRPGMRDRRERLADPVVRTVL